MTKTPDIELLIEILSSQVVHGVQLDLSSKEVETQLGQPDYKEIPYEIKDEDVWQQENWTYKNMTLVFVKRRLVVISLDLIPTDILESDSMSSEGVTSMGEMKYEQVLSILKKEGFLCQCTNDPSFLESDNFDQRELLFLPNENAILKFDTKHSYRLAQIDFKDKKHYGNWKLADF